MFDYTIIDSIFSGFFPFQGLFWSLTCLYIIYDYDIKLYGTLIKSNYYSDNQAIELAAHGVLSMSLTIVNVICILIMGVLTLKVSLSHHFSLFSIFFLILNILNFQQLKKVSPLNNQKNQYHLWKNHFVRNMNQEKYSTELNGVKNNDVKVDFLRNKNFEKFHRSMGDSEMKSFSQFTNFPIQLSKRRNSFGSDESWTTTKS